jgi:hypothetical protein
LIKKQATALVEEMSKKTNKKKCHAVESDNDNTSADANKKAPTKKRHSLWCTLPIPLTSYGNRMN